MPLWVSIVIGGLILGSLVLIVRNKRNSNAAEAQEKRTPSFSFTPLNVFLVLALVARAAVIALNEPLSDAMLAVQGSRVAAYCIAILAGLLLGQAVLWMKDLFFETATSSVRLLNVLFAPSDDPGKIKQ